jgi:hypothetical protein
MGARALEQRAPSIIEAWFFSSGKMNEYAHAFSGVDGVVLLTPAILAPILASCFHTLSTAAAYDLYSRLFRGSGFQPFAIRVFTARYRFSMNMKSKIERSRPPRQGFMSRGLGPDVPSVRDNASSTNRQARIIQHRVNQIPASLAHR